MPPDPMPDPMPPDPMPPDSMPEQRLTPGVRAVGAGVEVADAVVVAIHGRGQSPAYLIEHLVERVDDPTIAWLLPEAAGGSWYPAGFLAATAENQPALDHARAAMDEIVDHLDGLDPRRVVWAGFSQGACLACDVVARHPRRWGGLAVLTGGLIGPPGTTMWIPDLLDGMPAYVGVGAADGLAPRWRVEETVAAFRLAGADVTFDVFDDGDHVIRDAEIARVVELVGHVRTRA